MDAQPAPRTTAAQARYGLTVLLAVALFNYIDRMLIAVLQVPIKGELGLSDTQLGALTGLAFALFYVAAAIPIARLADRHRRVWLLATALAVWSSMTALSALANSFIVLLILRMGVAVGEAGCVPPTHSLLSDFYPPNKRGRAFALWACAPPIGMLIGIASGGWLANDLGWRTSFALIGGLGLLLLPFLLKIKEPRRGQYDPVPSSHAKGIPFREAVGIYWRSRAFRYLIGGLTCQAFAISAVNNWLPPFYSRVHNIPLAELALFVALMMGLAGGVGAFLGGTMLDPLVRRDVRWYSWLPSLTLLVAFPFFIAMFVVSSVNLSIACGFIAFLFAGAYLAPVNVTAQALVPAEMRALTSAVLMLVPTTLGVGMGPLVAGALSDLLTLRYGMGPDALRYAVLACVMVWIPSIILWLAMARHLKGEVRV